MIGVLVVSHNTFSKALLETGDMILGNHNNCYSLGLTDKGVYEFGQAVQAQLDSMFKIYDEILVLCDLKGGTPYNEVLKYKLKNGKQNMVIITGFNLPMFAELIVLLPDADHVNGLAKNILEASKSSIEIDNDEEVENDDMFD